MCNVLKLTADFQKLLLMSTFAFDGYRCEADKSKLSGYTANNAVLLLFTLSFCISMFFYDDGIWIAMPMIFSMTIVYAFFIMNRRLFEIIPVKKRTVVSNLLLMYPLFFIPLVLIAVIILIIVDCVLTVLNINSAGFILFLSNILAPLLKPVLLGFLIGMCIFAAWLAIYLVGREWLKVTLAVILSAGIMVPKVCSHFFLNTGLFEDIDLIQSVNNLGTGTYCISLSASCAIFIMFYTLCVKIYGHGA